MRSKNILQLLEESKYTVAISGKEMFLENGYPGVRDGEESYEIEQKYGYSAEEILSSAFYATRKDVFFEFYRTEMLAAAAIPPGKGFLNLQKMEEYGLVPVSYTHLDVYKRQEYDYAIF